MGSFLKVSVTFIQVIIYITGVFTTDVNIHYSGNEHIQQKIASPMTIVENGNSDFITKRSNLC